jgi:signal transduction histidine kinase/ActR/RegA family two-component response regulator
LRTRLFLLVAGTVVPLVALAAVLGALLVDHQREIYRLGAIDRNRAFISAVDAELRGHITSLKSLAAARSIDNHAMRKFHNHAVRVLDSQPAWQNVILSTPDGQQVVNALVDHGSPLPSPIDSESVRRVAASRMPGVGPVRMRPLSGKYGVAVHVPVVRDGEVVFVVTAIVGTDPFQRLIGAQNLPDGWVSGLVDESGHYVARVPFRPPTAVAGKEFLAAVARSPEGWYRGATAEGLDSFSAHKTSALSGWSIGLAIPTSLVYGAATRFGWMLIAGTFATIAMAFVIAWWLSRRISRPIASLAGAARALGNDQPPPPLEDVRGIDELQPVAAALHDASAAIREREALVEREQAALREADRAKDEFLAMLGHELRNPLSAISTSAHVLGAALPGSAVEQQARGVIERQSRQMTRLVDDLLDISRLTMGKVALELESFDLAQLTERLVQTWEQSSRVVPGRIALDLHAAWIRADRARIEQVLANLLDNANKFTPPGNAIRVAVRAEAVHAVLEIDDEGDGIEPEMVDSMFRLFVQGTQGADRGRGGLGLGLALVRRLVEMHGGEVSARSAGPGTGATFTVRIPAIDPASVETGRARAAPKSTRALRILVVEDNADGREIMETALVMEGHEVRTAGDGEAGLEAAMQWRPHVVLLDIGLPGMDGYDVARRLREDLATRSVRLVALTGYGQPEDERRAYAAGFDIHLTKPVNPARLAELLQDFSGATHLAESQAWKG